MKIAYFGLPLGALLLAQGGHALTSVAICRRACLGLRRARRVFGDRLMVTPRLDDQRLHANLAGADLLVSWFWTKKLPTSLLGRFPLGSLGVHPSLLPRHRGPDPYFWAIERGDAVTGVTAHRLAADYDTGAMLGKKSLPIDPTWNAWQLAKALDRPSLALLREVAAALARGEAPAEIEQDEAFATDAPEPPDDLGEVDPSLDPEAFLRRIRALAPAPGAVIAVGDRELTVVAAAPAPRRIENLEEGDLAVVEEIVVLGVRGGAVTLTEVLEDDVPLAPEAFRALVRRAGER